MPHHLTVFHALIKTIPRPAFERLAQAHGATWRVRRLDCWTQLLALLYGQLAGVASLRDLVAALASQQPWLARLGLAPVHRATLSDANRRRPAALYQALLARLLLPRLATALAGAGGAGPVLRLVRLIDATVLPLPALTRDWARFADRVAGVKLHVVYDPAAACPTYFAITPARTNDIVPAHAMPLEAGATYVCDLGYYAFAFFAAIAAAGGRFVTRLKANSPVQVIAERPVAAAAILSDRVVRLNDRLAASRRNPCRMPLREIVVHRDEGRPLRLLTNDLATPAVEIARLYRARWEIELFFRWLKQNLKLKHFLGRNENAVRLQILAALIAYLLLRLAQVTLPGSASLRRVARLIRLNLLHRIRLADLLAPPPPGRAAEPRFTPVCHHAVC